jgi:hypothetical protein
LAIAGGILPNRGGPPSSSASGGVGFQKGVLRADRCEHWSNLFKGATHRNYFHAVGSQDAYFEERGR